MGQTKALYNAVSLFSTALQEAHPDMASGGSRRLCPGRAAWLCETLPRPPCTDRAREWHHGTPGACPTHRLCDQQHSCWWRPRCWEPLHVVQDLCYTSERGRSLLWQVRSVLRWSQSVSLHCRSGQGEAGSDSPAVHQGCSSMHKALLRAQPRPSCSGLAHQTVLMSIYRSGGTTLGPGCPMTAGDEGH